jgi:hypothetical protein
VVREERPGVVICRVHCMFMSRGAIMSLCRWSLAMLCAGVSLVNLRGALAQESTCAAPKPIRMLLARRYADWKIVDASDLERSDQESWFKRYGTRCPGLVTGHFTRSAGDSEYVALLTKKTRRGVFETAVLFTSSGARQRYSTKTLSKPGLTTTASVLWRLPSGRYTAVDEDATIRAPFDVIIYEKIEAGALLFYWRDGRFHSIPYSI